MLAEIEEVQIRCYTDGGCDGNGAGGRWGAAGWGAHILRTTEANDEASVCAELWGPVETDPDSVWYCGAERGTNNTGEIIGIGQALMWLRDVDESSTPAAMLFDSCYAANMVTGRWRPNKNMALISWARRLSLNPPYERPHNYKCNYYKYYYYSTIAITIAVAIAIAIHLRNLSIGASIVE